MEEQRKAQVSNLGRICCGTTRGQSPELNSERDRVWLVVVYDLMSLMGYRCAMLMRQSRRRLEPGWLLVEKLGRA